YQQARAQIREHRREIAAIERQLQAPSSEPYKVRPGDTLVIEVLEALPGRPISGERIVRPDGTISLGFYGDLAVVGLDRNEIKTRLVKHLQEWLKDDVLGLVAQDDRGRTVSIVPVK